MKWVHTGVICALVAMATLVQIWAQQGNRQGNVCVDQRTCGSCIVAGPACGWCRQENFSLSRCDLMENLVHVKDCEPTLIIHPDHTMERIKDDPPKNSDADTDAIQLSPQELTISLRPNKPHTFEVTFRQAEHYPVDLYYIMDLSQSMKDDKAKLAGLGDLLSAHMKNITNNFRLGFGSFVDKVTMPYVSIVPQKLIKPCDGCVAPYGFHNQLPLTTRTSDFKDLVSITDPCRPLGARQLINYDGKTKVNDAPISGNLDSPEGGFDAIMQSIMCDNEIRWREASRKMLLFSTDAGFHYAGDGKLGGIVTPNDGHCHLDSQGLYTESLNQDYPSISQISHKIAEKKVNVIFAVTKSQMNIYEQLSDYIEGSLVGELSDDSDNIVQLVEENYQKISSKVELKTEGAEGVTVKFKSRCQGVDFTDSSKCDDLGIGKNVTFQVTIQVESCPADRTEWEKSFSIYPVGLTEKLMVHLSLICECPCEGPGKGTPNSEHCAHSGTYVCGGCTCNEGHYGPRCECNTTSVHNKDYDASCRMTNTSEVCENHGQCVCGQCSCFSTSQAEPSHRWTGEFCDCNNFKCPHFEGAICGGHTRGKCDCGKCECQPDFTGDRCQCPKTNEPCRASNGLICNGKGTCECGRCNCNLDEYYRGQTCEDCPTCPGKCDENKACVLCEAFKSGDLTKEYCEENCTHVTVVEHVEDLTHVKMCQFRDDDDCDYFFTYEYETGDVLAQQEKNCPAPVNVLAIVLGVIGGIIAIGFALLVIWKIVVTLHDRREFAKFEKERQNAKWDMEENPIYKQATSTFKNPMYNN